MSYMPHGSLESIFDAVVTPSTPFVAHCVGAIRTSQIPSLLLSGSWIYFPWIHVMRANSRICILLVSGFSGWWARIHGHYSSAESSMVEPRVWTVDAGHIQAHSKSCDCASKDTPEVSSLKTTLFISNQKPWNCTVHPQLCVMGSLSNDFGTGEAHDNTRCVESDWLGKWLMV